MKAESVDEGTKPSHEVLRNVVFTRISRRTC
jgi:hypothetical protein